MNLRIANQALYESEINRAQVYKKNLDSRLEQRYRNKHREKALRRIPLFFFDVFRPALPKPVCDWVMNQFFSKDFFCYRLLNDENFQEVVLDKLKGDEVAKAQYVYSRFKQLKQDESIKLGWEERKRGSSAAAIKNIVLINPAIFNESKEEIDFTLCHEISHVTSNHYKKTKALEPVIILAYIIATIAIPILGFFIAEEQIYQYESQFSKEQEKEADLKAIQFLGTNKGAITWIRREIDKMAYALYPNLKKREKDLFPGQIFTIKKIYADVIGNTHPSMTKRFDYCTKKTQPVIIS